MERNIFSGPEIEVNAWPGKTSRLVVTFTSYKQPGTEKRSGWFESLKRLDYASLVFIAKENHWYNTVDLADALAAANAYAAPYRERHLVGGSMGGHAALRLASRLGATSVVAVSPQYCIRRELVPFETRWQAEAAAIPRYEDPIRSFPFACPTYLIYDSENEADVRHVDMIARDVDCERIGLPDSGHTSSKALADIDRLDNLFALSSDRTANARLLADLTETYAAESRRCASVILARLGRLEEPERSRYLATLPAEIIGISESRARVDRLRRRAAADASAWSPSGLVRKLRGYWRL